MIKIFTQCYNCLDDLELPSRYTLMSLCGNLLKIELLIWQLQKCRISVFLNEELLDWRLHKSLCQKSNFLIPISLQSDGLTFDISILDLFN